MRLLITLISYDILTTAEIYLSRTISSYSGILSGMASRTLVVCFFLVSVALSLHMEIMNRCNRTLWPAMNSNWSGAPLPRALNYGDTFKYNAPDDFHGRIWAKSHCDVNGINCKVGDCGKANCYMASSLNTTLFEFNAMNGTLWFDISLGRRKYAG